MFSCGGVDVYSAGFHRRPCASRVDALFEVAFWAALAGSSDHGEGAVVALEEDASFEVGDPVSCGVFFVGELHEDGCPVALEDLAGLLWSGAVGWAG